MKTFFQIIAALLFTTNLVAQAPSLQGAVSTDEGIVKSYMQEMMDGFNNKDAALFVKHLADKLDFIPPNAYHATNKMEIRKMHEQLFQGPLKNSTWNNLDLQANLLSENVANVIAKGSSTDIDPETGKEISFRGIISGVFLKEGGDWKIVQLQVTSVPAE
ncbi:MAG: nuclear transport factor 2 family protein [Phaeodactylibacter sp.]|nr:nuclear transport factor 2 family protein [Phaeodactylibacter sp.]MCB9264155.1 nuclear transport factor 2 family protein [Lewinellaceae bacterium]